MKRYELLKLVPGTDPVEVQEKMWKTYRKLDDELDWLNRPVIHRSCREGDDYDLVVVIEIDQEERLSEYLSHPLMLKLEGKLEGDIEKRAAFDHY